MKNYSFILFDWDGCLAKSLDIVLDAYKAVFAVYDIYPDDRTITHEVFGDWNGPKKLGIKDIDTYTQRFLSKVNEKYPSVTLYKDVYDVLVKLKSKGKKMALITTSKRDSIQPVLINNRLDSMFDVILAAEDVSNHKPDPEIINKAIVRLGGSKDTSILVGDSKSDLGAANNAGIASILFYPKHNERFYKINELKKFKPTYIVNDFKKVLDIIT